MNRNNSLVFHGPLLLLAFGMGACSSTPINLGEGRDGVSAVGPTPDVDHDADVTSGCADGEQEYENGETFVSDCNTCTCDEGTFRCTQKECSVEPEEGEMPQDGCSYAGAVYASGASFPSEDRCNTCTCESGVVACTDIACEATPDGCGYDGRVYAIGESYSYAGGLTVCTCTVDGPECVTEDMCNAAARLCEEAGGNPTECAERYAGCMPQTGPTIEACDADLATCKRDAMSMTGEPVDCDAKYRTCVSQLEPQPTMPFECDVSYANCLEAAPMDPTGECSMAYNRCAGNIDPNNPLAACGQSLSACQMEGGDTCEADYILCVRGDSEPETNPGTCELDGMTYANGAELPSSDCNSRYCYDGMIVTTLVYCQDAGAPN